MQNNKGLIGYIKTHTIGFMQLVILWLLDTACYLKTYFWHYLSVLVCGLFKFQMKFVSNKGVIYASTVPGEDNVDLTIPVLYFFKTESLPTCTRLSMFLANCMHKVPQKIDILYLRGDTVYKLRIDLAEEYEHIGGKTLEFGEIEISKHLNSENIVLFD